MMMEVLFWKAELCIHCTSVLLSSAQVCRSSSMRVHHDCGYHAARDAHSGKLFISDMIRLRMSASPRVQQKKTKSKQYQTIKAFQPTSMKAWEATVTTSLNFLECSFNIDGIAVTFRGGEDENSQNNRNAASCVLLTACTALYDSRYAASVVDILQHPSDLPTCIRSPIHASLHVSPLHGQAIIVSGSGWLRGATGGGDDDSTTANTKTMQQRCRRGRRLGERHTPRVGGALSLATLHVELH